jgi:hypothetical protein
MAEKNGAPAKTAAAKPKFRITVLNTAFSGERHGVTFKDGVGETENAKLAHACLEITGAKVTKDGKEWPEPDAKQQDPSKAD